jgi:tetratricopeptide (TPR) repeat protein
VKLLSSRIACLCIALITAAAVQAQPDPALDPEIRGRYEEALARNPFQDRAFDAVFASYFGTDGVDAWIAKLTGDAPEAIDASNLVLLGRIHARLFEPDKAVEYLERVEGPLTEDPQFDLLLGRIYEAADLREDAIARLSAALDRLTDSEQRAEAARILGNLLTRLGRGDEAAETWKRIAGDDDSDVYALHAFAELYEENRKWSDAIDLRSRIIAASEDDPYAQCREWRAIGGLWMQQDAFEKAAAAYERGLELAAPGNWLFADLKQRLLAVYERWNNLEGFAAYVQARIDVNSADVEYRLLLADTRKRQGEMDAAEAALNDVLARAPGHVGAHESLIALYNATDRGDDARRLLAALAEQYPEDVEYVRRLGEAYRNEGLDEQAVATWKTIVDDDAGADRYALLGQWFERYEKTAEAIDAYRKALALEDSRERRLRLAELLFSNGDEDEAVAMWQSTLEPPTDSPAEHVEVAMLMTARNLLPEAEVLLVKALEAAPDDGPARLNLAKLLVRQKRFEDAIPHFEQLADQETLPYLRERGIHGMLDAYSSLGKLQAQKEKWEAALEQTPDSLPLLAKLAELEMRLGNKREVVRLYERCVAIAPEEPVYRLSLARAYRASELVLESIEQYKELIALDKARAAGYYRELAEVCAEERFTEQAVTVAKAIVDHSPADFVARRNLARALADNGQREEAFQAYRDALQLQPGDADCLREFGALLAQFGKFGEAQTAFRGMFTHAPNERMRLDAVRVLAELYADRGDITALIREFQARVDRSPDDPTAHEELAAVYSAVGDSGRAVAVLEDALRFSENEEDGLRKLLAAAYEAGDLRKVIAVHHQLESLRGSLTARERERLGVAYARIGDYRNAFAAWDALVNDEYVKPGDLQSLAAIMRDEGFSTRALRVTGRATEMEPYNYALRYQYAIHLAMAERTRPAIEQLKTILELGEAPPEGTEGPASHTPRSNDSVLAQQRQGLSKKPPLRLLEEAGDAWRGPFADFRRVVIFALVHVAQSTGTADGIVNEFREASEADPKSSLAKEDLLIAYQAASRWHSALEVAAVLVKEQPDNFWLLREIALMKQKQERIRSAIERHQEHLDTYPGSRISASLSILPMLYQRGEDERAAEIVDMLTAEYGDDRRIMYPLASVLHSFGQISDVIALYQRLAETESGGASPALVKLARLYEHQGDFGRAAGIYQDLLFAESTPGQRTGRFDDRDAQAGQGRIHGVAELIVKFGWDVDWQRVEAFNALTQLPESNGDALEQCRAIADAYDANQPSTLALDLNKLLIAQAIQTDDYAAARSRLSALRQEDVRDRDITSFRFFDDFMTTESATAS